MTIANNTNYSGPTYFGSGGGGLVLQNCGTFQSTVYFQGNNQTLELNSTPTSGVMYFSSWSDDGIHSGGYTGCVLNKTGVGEVIITVYNINFTGQINVSAGNLQVQNLGALGDQSGPAYNPVSVAAGGILSADATPLNYANNITLAPASGSLPGGMLGVGGNNLTLTGTINAGNGAIIGHYGNGNNNGSLIVQGDLAGSGTLVLTNPIYTNNMPYNNSTGAVVNAVQLTTFGQVLFGHGRYY